jgi:hypothetical protein
MTKRAAVAVALAAAALALTATPAAAQCVMCKTALTGSAEGRAMIADFNHAILLMVFAPYLVMGAFLAAVFRERIMARAARFGAAVQVSFGSVLRRRAASRLRDPA